MPDNRRFVSVFLVGLSALSTEGNLNLAVLAKSMCSRGILASRPVRTNAENQSRSPGLPKR